MVVKALPVSCLYTTSNKSKQICNTVLCHYVFGHFLRESVLSDGTHFPLYRKHPMYKDYTYIRTYIDVSKGSEDK